MHRLLAAPLICTLLAFGTIPAQAIDLDEMAAAISTGIGTAAVHQGTNGTPIVVFEERHDSYTMLLEECVSLIRLRNKYHLAAIGLEGFTKDADAWVDQPPRPDAAVTLVERGQLSSAAFMHMAFGTPVRPIEVASEHVGPSGNVGQAVFSYLLTFAQAALQEQEDRNSLTSSQVAEVNGYINSGDIDSLLDFAATYDDFIKTHWPIPADPPETYFADLQNQATADGLDVQQSAADAVQSYREFLVRRDAASKTMAAEAADLADGAKQPIAMVVGAAHTAAIVSILEAQHRPLIVVSVSPSFAGKEILFTDEQWIHLSQGTPVDQDQLTLNLYAHSAHMKPTERYNAPWLQTKADLYQTVDSLVRTVFGGGGGLPPIDWSKVTTASPEFGQRLVQVKSVLPPNSSVAVDFGLLSLGVMKDGRMVLIFPVTMTNSDGTKETIWIRAAPTKDFATTANLEVEDQLMKRLESGEGPDPLEKKPDADPADAEKTVEISRITEMSKGSSKEAVSRDVATK
jgi:hypothetical protein